MLSMKTLNRIPLELLFWIAALVLLGMAEPQGHHQAHHFTLCPLAGMGLDWCPGCGIGRSLTQLLHGNIAESIEHHWFGIPALLIISYRIGVLISARFLNMGFKLNYKEDKNV